MEEGTRTGLAIGFDAWQSGTGSAGRRRDGRALLGALEGGPERRRGPECLLEGQTNPDQLQRERVFSEPGPAGVCGPHGWFQPVPGGG
jgi:hypothetical protein